MTQLRDEQIVREKWPGAIEFYFDGMCYILDDLTGKELGHAWGNPSHMPEAWHDAAAQRIEAGKGNDGVDRCERKAARES